MKRYIVQIITILVLTLPATGTFAQDNRTLDTKVADLLAQFPASDLNYRDRLLNEMFELGPDGFQKITAQLTPPGEGDDTAAREAINSLARYASEMGKEDVRSFTETNILKALENQSNKEVKAFLIHQLNLIAGEKSVNVVKQYLTDDRLSEPATQLILEVGGKESAQVLLEALPNAEGKNQVTLVRALGELQCMKAVLQITPLVEGKTPQLQKAALAALANIGSPEFPI